MSTMASNLMLGALLLVSMGHSFVLGQEQQFGQQSGQLIRFQRQVSIPQQQQQPQQQPSSGFTSFLSNLGGGANQNNPGQLITSLFNPAAGQQQAGSSLAGAAQLMSQLSEMVRSSQDQVGRTIANTQQNVDNVNQQTLNSARNAQGGIQAALIELGQGIQRMATTNPTLLPDLKNLYQSVAARLTGASSSVSQAVTGAGSPNSNNNYGIVPATNSEQFADNLAKLALNG